MLKNVKAIELSRGGDSLTVQPVLLPIAAEETTLKPTVADISVKVGDKTFKLTGKNVELIDLNGIAYNGTPMAAKIADDKSYIMVSIPSSFPQTPGYYAITLKLIDPKSSPIGALVQIAKPGTGS
jgi:hypothetical protein